MKEVSLLHRTLSVSVIRRFLTEKRFVELFLPATTEYNIEGAKLYKAAPRLHLRYTAEPDIWLAGSHFEHFFWIGSCFRNVKPSQYTAQEFTMVAMYAKNQTTTQAVSLFFHMLREFEQRMHLLPISHKPLHYMTYKEFSKPEKKQDGWLVVTEFPKDKSFYDKDSALGNTLRFCIYYIHNGKAVDIASGGTVGENLNKKMYIKGGVMPNDFLTERLIGLRFGVERLMLLYEEEEKVK